MRKVIGTLVVLVAGGLGGGAMALADSAGTAQYGGGTTTATTPTTNPTTGTPTTTTPTTTYGRTMTTGAGSGKLSPSGSAPSGLKDGSGVKDKSASGGSTGADAGAAGAAGGAAAATVTGALPPGTRVAFLQFGSAPANLKGDIRVAMQRVGLPIIFTGDANRKRLDRFLASPEAKALSTEGPRAVGKAVGAQLVSPTPAMTAAFPVLFGPKTPFVPVIRAILTRRKNITPEQVAFQLGLAEGLRSTGVPVAYVERTKTLPTFLTDYSTLQVPTVDDVDTDPGKYELGQIMLGLGKFAATTKVGSDRTAASVAGSSAGSGGGIGGAAPYALLIGLLGVGALWVTSVMMRGGGGRRRSAVR